MSESGFNEPVDPIERLARGFGLVMLRHDEMLEALRQIIDWLHNPTKYPPYGVRTTFIDKCSQLIAKAEWRTP
jgi:hypothetical protein